MSATHSMTQIRRSLISTAVTLAIVGYATAVHAFSTAPGWMPMTMLIVSFDASTMTLNVQDQASPIMLALDTVSGTGKADFTATTFGTFDPAQPWSVAQDTGFSRQLGWWAGSGTAPATLKANVEAAYGAGASLWIESISQSAGLDSYLAIGKYGVNVDNTMTVDPLAHGYSGIFGTGGSATKWQWDYQMDHNLYTVGSAHLVANQLYSANYSVYVGDASGNPIGASSTETWTWRAPAVVPEPGTAALLLTGLAGLGAAGSAGRRRG